MIRSRVPTTPLTSPLRCWSAAAHLSLAVSLICGCSASETDPAVPRTARSSAATSDPSVTESRPRVMVVSYPLEYFARRIGGDLIRVEFPVPADQDPAYWEPSGDQIAVIQSADLVLLNGADYAKWTLRATLPWSRTVVTTEGLEEALIEIPDAVVHNHGPEGEHSHAGLVAETWLDPALAIQQAHTVYDSLCRLAPEHKTELERRFLDLQQDLKLLADDLDDTLTETSTKWFSAKPQFHYLLARYDMTPIVLHWEADETVDSARWESLTSQLDGSPAILLWNEAPLKATRDRLAAEDIQSVVVDTAARTPEQGDFLTVMRSNLDAIRSAIASSKTPSEPDE